jgi:hypothetical protein
MEVHIVDNGPVDVEDDGTWRESQRHT